MSWFDAFALSEAGQDGHANEDFAIADSDHGIFVVADGMGGRPGGAQASRLAAETFHAYLCRFGPADRVEPERLRAAVGAANLEIHSVTNARQHFSGSGSTLSAAVLHGSCGKIVHVGDSRVYIVRPTGLEQLTVDHTLATELALRNGQGTERPEHRRFRHILSRSVGPQRTVEPDVRDVLLAPDDWLVLATDGVSKALNAEQLWKIFVTQDDQGAELLCRAIMKAALVASPGDNVTVMVVRLMPAEPTDPEPLDETLSPAGKGP